MIIPIFYFVVVTSVVSPAEAWARRPNRSVVSYRCEINVSTDSRQASRKRPCSVWGYEVGDF